MTRDQLQRRAWDAYDVYLFDIDGTLLSCTDAVHYFAFCKVLSLVADRPVNLDGVVAHGNTDVGILRDAFRIANVPEATWRPKLVEMQQQMCHFVELHRNDLSITVLPKVFEVLEHLHSRGALLGVATGNLKGIGQVKLQRCDLLRQFDFGEYSDPYEYRHDVFRGAVLQARALAAEDASLCVVGDTPEDIRSARLNGLDVIAVATGIYDYESLRKEEPNWCLRSLADLAVSP